ncbi:hypothetical protein RZO55_20335 [Clostridium boliviensis]|uniref:Uncharacterized protein n=1 Tax=Clostridium boliviensis TaxID=318465 RepID=A0ABU4GQR6_9CLOT|nr:hypothetical protein [Clostridium boliviensis]MDW2799924.1 hypothetical protein [Clostridium boliviensis]
MEYRSFLHTIYKAVALGLSVAALVLLILNVGSYKTWLTTLSVSVICLTLSQFDRRNK